ncbi:protein SIEL [Argentina anserina]|uniref:protein SIEL n=1 Tax=Argentina anserina TaxID=57926 RepID=UPI0021767D4B|nr:protein SIEL [Potentilla anserina]
MEAHATGACNQSLNLQSISPSGEPLSTETLASLRSLITNPSTPAPAISSIAETLTRSLHLSRDPHRTLKLLSDLAAHHPHLSPLVFHSVRSNSLLSTESTRVAAESLDVLASIGDRNQDLAPAVEKIDDRLFASLCFSPSPEVRPWLLRNAGRFSVQPYLLSILFLGFTKDPYADVRTAALDGLVGLSESGAIDDGDVIRGCYFRAGELLNDMEVGVRCAAIRAVLAWGLTLVDCDSEAKAYWSDEVFVKICSVVRDMSVEVRIEAFNALGRIGMVSQDILLQTLSKKVLVTPKEKKSLAQSSDEQMEISGCSFAGAFMHGLEDEFHEVRKAACHSLGKLTKLSSKFAGEALNLLMDVLNDDSVLVRLEAFEIMHQMATSGHLKVQDKHMHMFLGTLVDCNTLTRSAARKILKLAKLPDLKLFRSTIDTLLDNLDMFPQDEEDILNVLFHIGRNHGKFVVRIIKEVSHQMEPVANGKLGFDNVRVAALLVLAISAPLSQERDCRIPPSIFSYAVTYLGRISSALSDVIHQDGLLNYLSHCSRSSGPYDIKFDFRERELPGSVAMPLPPERGGISEIFSPTVKESREAGTSLVKYSLDVHDVETKLINVVLEKVKDIWPFVQAGYTTEALRTLRNYRKELATLASGSIASGGSFAFTMQYLKILKLLAKAWVNILPSSGMGDMDFVLEKLDARLSELKSMFLRLSKEEELHILELILVTCMLKLSKVEICCHLGSFRKLSCTMAHAESLLRDGSGSGSVEPSRFMIEVRKLSSEIGTSVNGSSFNPIPFRRALESFSLNQLMLCGGLKQIKADLDIADNDNDHPLRFVAGLPVGIPCHITLHNVLVQSRIWLKMTVNGIDDTQFVYLDPTLLSGCDDRRRVTFIAPFYKTPKALSFTVGVCICMEHLSEVDNASSLKRCGPRHELSYLCQEKEVFLSMVK